jgi:uncharacterized protein YbaR (Trm112 family)
VAGRGGAVTAIQRCGAALNTNVHFHTLLAEGVFATAPDGAVRFVAAVRPPSDAEVGRVLATVRRRVVRLARRRGVPLDESAADADAAAALAVAEPALAAIAGASVIGRVATGPRAGQRVLRLGSGSRAAVVTSAGPRHAHRDGFDLHADTAVRAGDRRRLERLCRYVLRPPVAQEALELTAEGQVRLRLRRPWRDGTRALCFEPSELLERLAALVPRPRVNLLVYHGAFAARGCWRVAGAVAPRPTAAAAAPLAAPGAPPAPPPGPAAPAPVGPAADPRPPPAESVRPRHVAWAELLRRTFALDVLACPDCGGRLRLVATIADPRVIARILAHLRAAAGAAVPGPGTAAERAAATLVSADGNCPENAELICPPNPSRGTDPRPTKDVERSHAQEGGRDGDSSAGGARCLREGHRGRVGSGPAHGAAGGGAGRPAERAAARRPAQQAGLV